MTLHRQIIRIALAGAVLAVPLHGSGAQATYGTQPPGEAFTTDQLDNLVAPIALYPDAILAQVLIAATFPEQIEFAVRYVRANGTRGIEDQAWDVSVKSVAHYPPVLNLLAERPDWTTALGQAYALQSGDVMDAVQRLRAMAHAQGNLASTPEQEVIVERERIVIVPAQPQIIYVPTYDPWAIYYRPVFYATGYRSHWSFGIGFPVGAWLIYDCDWWSRNVYYHGWRNVGWWGYARPYVHITNVYVHPRYEVVHVNRTVVHRTVNYVNVNRYVHRETDFASRRGGRGGPGGPPAGRGDGRGDRGQRGDDGADARRTGRGEVQGTVQRPITTQRPQSLERSGTVTQPVTPSRPATVQRPVTTQRPVTAQRPVTVERSVPVQRPVTTRPPVSTPRPTTQRVVPTQRPPTSYQRPATVTIPRTVTPPPRTVNPPSRAVNKSSGSRQVQVPAVIPRQSQSPPVMPRSPGASGPSRAVVPSRVVVPSRGSATVRKKDGR